MDTIMEDVPAGEYDASPDAMEGIEYHPSVAPRGRSYQSPQQILRRNLLSNSNLHSGPTLQLSTLRDRQARRQQVTRRWQPRPYDPFYHDMEEARAENRAEQRAFDRSHLRKRDGVRFPFSSPKRTRTAYEQDTSDQRRIVDATPRRAVDDATRPLLDVTPQLLVDAPARQIGDRAQNLLDDSPRLLVDAAHQPLIDTAPQQAVPVAPQLAPQPAQMLLWPAALYRRATWRAAVPPWRRILVPVSQIAQLARRTAEHGIQQTIQTGITVASAFAHLFDRRAEGPVPAPEAQMAAFAPAPVAQPTPEPAAEPVAEPETEPWDPVSVQLQAELTGHAFQVPSPPPSPPAHIEDFAPRCLLETLANAISEEDSIMMMVANATREARERERAATAAAEETAPQPLGEEKSHEIEAEADTQPDAAPQFALVPPLAPWVRSPIRFNPAVPQVATWPSVPSAPSSPELIPSSRPVGETPALDLAPPAHLVDEAPVLRLIPSSPRPIGTAPALDLAPIDEAPELGSNPLHAVEATPALGLAPPLHPSDQPPALGLSPLRHVDAPPAPLPIAPSSRPTDVTPALRLMPSSSRPVEMTSQPPPVAPNQPPVEDTSSPGPIAPSSSRSIPAAAEAHPESPPSRRLPMTPVTHVIPQLMRRYRATPAPRRAPRAARLPLDADIEETRNLLSAATVSGEDGIVPTRIQWWEADTPLGRPISAVRLFSSNEPPANVSANRTGALQSDEFEEMQREARMRVIRERTKALSRQRVPEGEAAVRPLSERMEQLVNSAMSATSNRVLGSTLEGAELTKQKLLTCYQDLAWLNDEVINGHLALTVDYLREKANNTGRNVRPKYYAFNSFFYSKLRDGGYKEVSRWARRAKIDGAHLLEVETVFVPVHQQSHWTLLVVSPVNKTIEYFDSLGSRWVSFVDTIKEWLKGELGDKYDEEEWTVLRTPSPKQDNGSDCGVFLLTTAKAVALGLEPTAYGPADIPLLRKKIVAELLNSGFRGDLDPSGPGPARL